MSAAVSSAAWSEDEPVCFHLNQSADINTTLFNVLDSLRRVCMHVGLIPEEV